MEDVELVLRFFSLIDENYLQYRKTKDKVFTDFLSDVMKRNNAEGDLKLKRLQIEFETTMSTILKYFGQTAFAKYKYEDDKYILQSKFNVAVFDALSTSCHDLIYMEKVKDFKNKSPLFLELFKDSSFYESVNGASLDSAKLRFRIEQAKSVLR
jgi:hypothetical protein